jgi:hypothetical protein
MRCYSLSPVSPVKMVIPRRIWHGRLWWLSVCAWHKMQPTCPLLGSPGGVGLRVIRAALADCCGVRPRGVKLCCRPMGGLVSVCGCVVACVPLLALLPCVGPARGCIGAAAGMRRAGAAGWLVAWGTKPNVPPHSENAPPNVPPRTPGFRHTSAHVCALVKATPHRGKEKGRKLAEATGLVCGARGRTRTGTPCGGGF